MSVPVKLVSLHQSLDIASGTGEVTSSLVLDILGTKVEVVIDDDDLLRRVITQMSGGAPNHADTEEVEVFDEAPTEYPPSYEGVPPADTRLGRLHTDRGTYSAPEEDEYLEDDELFPAG